jgi:hypothetical protein
MKLHPTVPTVLVLATTVLTGLTGCGAVGGTSATPAGGTVSAGLGSTDATSDSDADATSDSDADSGPDAGSGSDSDSDSDSGSDAGSGTSTRKPKHHSTPSPTATHKPKPRVVSFKVVQRPKCEEGTAVFRAKAVPLIIKWKITGADSGALSVDDPTGTPGTYGPVEKSGTQEFTFSCTGEVGSTETHTYAIYTVGGGPQKHKTLTVSAKVLDKGLGTD